MLRPVIERCRPLAEQKGLRLSLRGGQHWLYADAALVERVVMNLLSNAIKYTDHGGVLLACRRRGTKVRIEVHDSGIGVAPDDQTDIFQEFVQLANIERDPGKGLGIGLSICRALAKAMDTSIGMRSRPGRGSVFWIELPRGDVLEAAVSADTDDAGETDDETAPLVLLLEHDHAACLSRAGHLAAWGFEVMQAADGSAIRHALINGRRAAAILCCETSMSGEAGEALTRLLATQAETGSPGPLLIALTNDPGEDRGPDPDVSAPLWIALANARLSATAPPGRLRAMLNQLLLTRD
jgi:anti-sigma regulatory factor (Ser/Thr protein kinase)